MSDNNSSNNDVLFNEAPASWNTRYITPDGFECQLTIRGEKGAEVLEKASTALAYLLKTDCIPYAYHCKNHRALQTSANDANGNGSSNDEPATQDDSFCPIHQCEMKRWEKNGKTWYSHKVNGSWCNGKQG